MDAIHVQRTESAFMKASEKLAKLLTTGGGEISPTWLGEKLREAYGLRSGANLLYKWMDGTRSFTMRNRRAIEHIVGKPPHFLDDDDAPVPQAPPSTRAVLEAFLRSRLAAEMDPQPSPAEIAMLLEHKVDGDVTEEYFYYQLKAERARQKHPTGRPNVATAEAVRAGLRKTPHAGRQKAQRKPPSAG
jgi:hypothetical protein